MAQKKSIGNEKRAREEKKMYDLKIQEQEAKTQKTLEEFH